MQNFDADLKKYAHLIVKTGVNIQPSQTVVLYIAVTQQKLAHLITKEAYEAGANEVIVKWNDTYTTRQFLEHASLERLNNAPEYLSAEADYIVSKQAARISVISEDPDAFNGIDPKRIASYQTAMGKALHQVRKATQNNDLTWTVVAAADGPWAKKVFPDLDEQEATMRLWEEIFKTCRINTADPIKAWQEHDKKLRSKAKWLNDEQFSALHYTSAKTDLTVGLPKNHIWEGAGSFSASGIEFMANMPTEEVFTAADKDNISGYVTSTKPLSYAGNILEDISFTFENGHVTSVKAKNNTEILEDLIKTDKGASSLGEVALVPDPSPISRSKITFYNTLFDENASNHLALGNAYPFSIANGTTMDDEQLAEAGLNLSQIHVDFMMGSADMNIDGIKTDGTAVPIFRNGDWA